MKLLTRELRDRLPVIGATERDADPSACVKLFLPGTRWTWYLLEFDGDDLLFAFVKSGLDDAYDELGYVSLAELEQLRHPLGFRVERDIWFEPMSLSAITATTAIV